MLPQFNMENFLSTSLFVWIFIFITYKFLQSTIIKYIEDITLYSENQIKEIEKDNEEMEIKINLSYEEANKIKNEINKEYKTSEHLIQKTYRENIIKINEELQKKNKEKELLLKIKLQNKYKESNLTHILKDIKYNTLKKNQEESHDNS